jgi:hypothetical protein
MLRTSGLVALSASQIGVTLAQQMGAPEIIALASVVIAGLGLLLNWARGRKPDETETASISLQPAPAPAPPTPDPRTIDLLEEAVAELAKLGDLMAQMRMQLRGRPHSTFQTPHGRKVFEDLQERGNDWVTRSQSVRWRIEGTKAGHAFDAAMRSVIDYFNEVSMIKLEAEDFPLRMEPAGQEVQDYIHEKRGESERYLDNFEVQYAKFREEARQVAGFTTLS